ncbi:MAG: anaerobic ribonucleoside-triphosphate reductase [Candidatus Heimdallarchaeota archaeon]
MEQVNTKNRITKITEIKTAEEENEHASGTCGPNCAYCKSENVYGMSRVVGYFSIIENWNKSKKSELKRRQEGNYWSE